MSTEYQILSRDQTKIHKLTEKCSLLSAGCRADMDALWKVLDAKMVMYKYSIGKEMASPAVAQLLSNTLYYKRFFPYYSFNVLAGLDENGKGAVYDYDAIGSMEKKEYSASGSGTSFVIPALDNLIGFKTRTEPKPIRSVDECIELVKDLFVSIGERDIYTGDAIEICAITSAGMKTEIFQLKRD
mmetsp:Transcript_965/g.1450  ORF Transcript_965/g.1450 Transcript_965/m.1450 type:complete len:185 (+) Transcript_965:3-557(+)